jgi:probable phosphoglycerate mutase
MAHDDPRRLVLVRHGETAWSRSGQHTGRTDVPLTDVGRAQAAALEGALPVDRQGALVLTSPLSRAADTAALAGFPDAIRDDDLLEWDYGTVEGRTTAQLRASDPTWDIWRDGAPGGETVEEVGTRVDRVIARCRATDRACVLFAHAHVLRILTARWLGLAADGGRLFVLDPAHCSVLGWQRETPVIQAWNLGRTTGPDDPGPST